MKKIQHALHQHPQLATLAVVCTKVLLPYALAALLLLMAQAGGGR